MSSSEPCTDFRVRHPDEGRRPASLVGPGCVVLLAAVLLVDAACAAETWRGLTLAPEHRCSPYDRKRDYPYPQSVEREIVHGLGTIYGPYTGTCFGSTSETDIEHIVAASEAHDSGCVRATRARFATDLRNLTLASPHVNRRRKGGKDPAEWLSARNRCWFAARVVQVRRAYNLTIDRHEAAALERVLAACESTALEPFACDGNAPSSPSVGSNRNDAGDALARYDDNRNSRITCAEARLHRIAPVHRTHPAYRYMRDADGDGVVCE